MILILTLLTQQHTNEIQALRNTLNKLVVTRFQTYQFSLGSALKIRDGGRPAQSTVVSGDALQWVKGTSSLLR